MKAEDTIIHADGCTTNLGVIGAVCNCGAEAQADISFKAGTKEVVEWLKQYAIHGGATPLSSVLDDLKIHSPYGG